METRRRTVAGCFAIFRNENLSYISAVGTLINGRLMNHWWMRDLAHAKQIDTNLYLLWHSPRHGDISWVAAFIGFVAQAKLVWFFEHQNVRSSHNLPFGFNPGDAVTGTQGIGV